MTFSVDDVRTWVALMLGTLSLAGTVWNWTQTRSRDNGQKLDAQDKRITKVETQVAAIDQEMQHLPSKDAVHKIEVDLAKISGEISTIGKSAESLQNTTRRIEGYLLDKGK